MDLGVALIVLAWILVGVMFVLQHKGRELVDFSDLTQSQIRRFFDAVERGSADHPLHAAPFDAPSLDDAIRKAWLIEPPVTPFENLFREPPLDEDGDDIPPLPLDPQDIGPDPLQADPLQLAEGQLGQVIVGAARAWRHRSPGAGDALAKYVDSLERLLAEAGVED